jgi:transcriptional regulator with XRE-family HTH domain
MQSEPMVAAGPLPFGRLLREWRERRRLSQMDLALDAGISTKHLSFVETGRAQPSRDMIVLLAERLAVPLRERNTLLMAAGFAPLYRERPLSDPALGAARAAVERLLAAHEPHPALAVDRHWNLITANRLVPPLLSADDAALMRAPLNVLRLSLHPRGLAPRIIGFARWRAQILARLAQQVAASGDSVLAELLHELAAYPMPADEHGASSESVEPEPVALVMRLRTDHGVLSFLTATTMFGTPAEVTLSELAIESFFPADEATARSLREIAAALPNR